MNPAPSQSTAYHQPSFFPPSSSSSLNSSPPTSWNSLPRPRLKRAHSSGQPPAPPNNSPQGPLSPALHTAVLNSSSSSSPHYSASLTATSDPASSNISAGIPINRSRNGSLEIIQEVPQAETLATSPPLIGFSNGSTVRQEEQEDRPSKSKRRRIAPDHEAFARLSLNYSPIPSNSTSTPFLSTPPSHSSAVSSAFLSSPLTSPTQPSFPSVPPTSPDFLPSHPHSFQQTSISPPNSSPLYAATTSSFTSSTIPAVSSAFTPTSMSSSEAEPEIEMNAQSSWDLDPHRIYVASLSDDEDEVTEARRKKEEEEKAEEQFRLNSLVANGLPAPSLMLDKRRKQDGALILYQPPPKLLGVNGGPKDETRVERIRREERERKKEEEFQEFRRESERIEADDLGGIDDQAGMEVEDGMEMEMEL
ncbi:hypothetical protein JCM3765_000108 [Sporobolomyces pararoseus]